MNFDIIYRKLHKTISSIFYSSRWRCGFRMANSKSVQFLSYAPDNKNAYFSIKSKSHHPLMSKGRKAMWNFRVSLPNRYGQWNSIGNVSRGHRDGWRSNSRLPRKSGVFRFCSSSVRTSKVSLIIYSINYNF